MQKIANNITGRTVLPTVGGTFLAFADVGQISFAIPTVNDGVANYVAWQAANPTVRPISVSHVMGNDGVPLLLVQHTTLAVAEPTNSVISSRLESWGDATSFTTGFQKWKTANPFQKIIRTTRITGLDGSVGSLIEFGINATIPNISNNLIYQTFFPDAPGAVNTSYASYLAWKRTTANASLKPYRLNYIIGLNGTTGLLVEYTNSGVNPSVSQLQLSFIDNTVIGARYDTAAAAISAIKIENPASQVYRITPVFQGFIIESTLNGTTPVNNSIIQSSYVATPAATDAITAYQTFKTANPTLKPIRLTPTTWGDGSNSILAEYIN